MRILSAAMGMAIAGLFSTAAIACGPNALGTSRTMQVDTSKYREIQGYEKSFGLKHKEVVLTFDDGPIAGKTPRILQALEKECVKATFFYVGRMAKVFPKLVRRVVREGHTLAHHTHAHNRLPNYSKKNASYHIDRGIRTLQKIAYSKDSTTPLVPFFRYPYLARNKATDKVLAQKGLIAFGANIDSTDWKRDTPEVVHDRIMRILRRQGKGIILMHDIQYRTAKMLPRLLRSLKKEGYRVVHIVPKPNKGGPRPAPTFDKDPIVVASVAPKTASHAQKERVARLTDEAEREVTQALRDAGIKVTVRSKVAAASPPKPRRIDDEVVETPTVIAKIQERQLKPLEKADPIKTASLKPVPAKIKKKRIKLETVAGQGTKRSTKRRIAKKQRAKTKKLRVARNRIITGNWKLRRSQWIIN